MRNEWLGWRPIDANQVFNIPLYLDTAPWNHRNPKWWHPPSTKSLDKKSLLLWGHKGGRLRCTIATTAEEPIALIRLWKWMYNCIKVTDGNTNVGMGFISRDLSENAWFLEGGRCSDRSRLMICQILGNVDAGFPAKASCMVNSPTPLPCSNLNDVVRLHFTLAGN